MSIDDDYFDMSAFVEERKLLPEWEHIDETWERFSSYTASVEQNNEQLRRRNAELEMTLKVMMGLKEETNNDMGN